MSYKLSDLDKENFQWFAKDDSRASLKTIFLREGHLRGLFPFRIDFEYPISVIAGKNGVGKSTILAMACCAFHNRKTAKCLPSRKTSYYTFSDFFVQAQGEVPPEGIDIRYAILCNSWAKTSKRPDGRGLGWQARIKKIGGKWNDYDERIDRDVVFFGIDRVVPHYEKSVSRSYRRRFTNKVAESWSKDVREAVGRILNKNYDDFWYSEHSKYRLPTVNTSQAKYTGFNMGAGETALFDIFSTIYSYNPGLLVIIDEIELGLHEEAQSRFIFELKKITKERKIQVICTTHSRAILDAVPPEGCFYLEGYNNETLVTPRVSSAYAAGKLAGENTNELDIYVEDDIGKDILSFALPYNTRIRVNILPIGSSKPIANQLAARFKEVKKGNCMACLDGDQKVRKDEIIKEFLSALEHVEDKASAKQWAEERIHFLPGDTWPVKWALVQLRQNDCTDLLKWLDISSAKLHGFIDDAIREGKHREFYTLAKRLSFEQERLTPVIFKHIIECNSKLFDEIREIVLSRLAD